MNIKLRQTVENYLKSLTSEQQKKLETYVPNIMIKDPNRDFFGLLNKHYDLSGKDHWILELIHNEEPELASFLSLGNTEWEQEYIIEQAKLLLIDKV